MAQPANVRVLLVEDDQDDARLVIDLLADSKRAKFRVDWADTATEGLNKVKKSRYDVLLLDYRLPGMTGMELMRELRALHFRIPVILITSHGDTRLQEEALEAGVAEFLEKGTFSADLLERTCLYAIGLNDRIIHDPASTNGVGIGILVQELVGLTREGVTAQTNVGHQISELRTDLKDEIGSLRSEIKEDVQRLENKVEGLKTHANQQKADILKTFSKGPWDKIKEGAEWTTKHPVASIVFFLALILIVLLTVLLLNVVDADNVKALKSAVVGSAKVLDHAPTPK